MLRSPPHSALPDPLMIQRAVYFHSESEDFGDFASDRMRRIDGRDYVDCAVFSMETKLPRFFSASCQGINRIPLLE